MGKKKKNNKVLVGSIVIILAVVSILIMVNVDFSDDVDQQPLSISLIDNSPVANIPLDFCNSEFSCLQYLSEQGMPDNFLKLNGYEISCQNGICNTQKI